MSDPLDTEAIRAAAEAATPGPWHVGASSVYVFPSPPGVSVARAQAPGDVRFIALMDPPTTLALVSELAALRAEVEALRALVQLVGGEVEVSEVGNLWWLLGAGTMKMLTADEAALLRSVLADTGETRP